MRFRRYDADVNIRSIIRPACSREPSEAQWEALEAALERLTHGATADPAESVVRSAVGAIEVARWQGASSWRPFSRRPARRRAATYSAVMPALERDAADRMNAILTS